MSLPAVSFEVFPPRNLQGSFRLWETMQSLAPFDPRFVSVTYGAGGTTRDLTHEAVTALNETAGLNVAAHLTCVNASRADVLKIAQGYADAGIREIVALRGDAPEGAGPVEDEFDSSVELIEALAATGDFTIRTAAYPEPHPDSRGHAQDLDWLKAKIDAGASEAITQFFFEADTFFRFRDDCAKAGITAPIIPGILPVESWGGLKRFAARCGASLPVWLVDAFDKAERDGRTDLLATAVATELASDLIEGGAESLHFYTLNKARLTRETCLALGLKPQSKLQNVA